ncbi:MAG: lipopolysaccharide biosynthesis protein [Acidimicrobiia bacterium]
MTDEATPVPGAPTAPGEPEPAEAGLGEDVKRGLKWSVLNMAVARLTSILSGIVLARILIPEDYGVFAPAMAVVAILFGLNDLGLLLAIVRWKGEDLREACRTAQTVAMGFSLALYVMVFAAAPWFCRAMNSPDSIPVLRVLALTVFIDGITTASHGLLVRFFMQDRFAKSEFAAMPVGVISSILLAWAGAGVWALALSQLLANVVSGVMLFRYAPFRVGFGFQWKIAKPMLAYGLPLALTSLVEYCLLNADYLIVSRALDPAAVGIYLLAYNVSNWPISIITDAVRRVSIAGFARLEGAEDSLRRNFSKAFSLLMSAAFPLLVCLGLFALPLITFVYGDQWVESASVLELLAILAGARMAIGFVFDLLVGVGRSRTTLVLKCVWLVFLVAGLEYGVRNGELRGVAIAHAVVSCAVALPLFLRAAAHAGADLADVARRLARPVVGAGVGFAVGLAVRDHLGGPALTTMLGGAIVVGVYVLVAVPRADLLAALDKVRRRRGGDIEEALDEELIDAAALVGQDPTVIATGETAEIVS